MKGIFVRKLILPLLLSAITALAADASLANLLPGGPRMVAGLNMSQSVNSPLGRYLLQQMKDDDQGLRKFIEATGFDPRRDLRELIVANYDAAGATVGKGHTLVVAKGNFDSVRVRTALLKDHTVSQMVGGFEILSGKDGQGAVAFLDPTTAVAGDLAQVKDALGAQAGRLPAEQQARIAQMSARYDAWIFTTTPMSSFTGKIAPDQPGAKALNGGQLLQGILQANGGVKFGNTVTMDAELLARSPKDAQALVDVFKFVTSMLQLGKETPDAKNEGIAALLEGMKIATNGNAVMLNFSVPEIELERILETGKGLKKQARPGVI
jgi:hypothetical protein